MRQDPRGGGRFQNFTVAGVPFVHVTTAGLQPPSFIVPDWAGSRVADDPVYVTHRMGIASDATLRLVVACDLPQGNYYLDERGNVAIRLPAGALSGMRPQLLITTRPGFEYELISEQPEDVARLSREWHRTLLMLALPAREAGLVFHAAAFDIGGEFGVLCPGVSGAGKSTIASMMSAWGASVLSDDRIALTHRDDLLRLWGTPWHSSANLASPAESECRALVFVRHGTGAALARLNASEAARRIFRTVALPFWDAGGTEFALSLIDVLVTRVPAFEFTYAPSERASAVLAAALREL